ncbi:MAG: ribosome biogenesis GTPase Der [Candidatus Omnitrophica bacterium]|nr:ribosome biogenesis GTPase Der [Candidatus Omnitrophota bacterium]
MEKKNLPKLAIVGRPNVGKSSLFNSIVGARKAIVESSSGTTRDRIHADIKWKGKSFTIIDMAGFEDARQDEMSELVLKQLRKGVEEADIIIFVTDGAAGIMPSDREFSSMLRKTSKKIYLVVNKIDSESVASRALDFYELGLGEPYSISAMHGRGIDKLCDDMVKSMERFVQPVSVAGVKVAIVGRPNVGKSSYLNALISEERVIVHIIAGTTRDAVDINFNYKGRDFVLIDTAGIRHNPKINRAADFYGGVRSEEAIGRSDVAIMLIDGYEGLMKDDARIIDLCLTKGKPLVIAVNKWDLVKETEMSKYNDRLIEEMSGIRNVPTVFISAKTGRNVNDSLDTIWSVYERANATIPSEKLAETLKALNAAPQIYGKKIKFKCLVQASSAPPEFVVGIASASSLNDNLQRFVENFVRKAYDFKGVPIKIRYR